MNVNARYLLAVIAALFAVAAIYLSILIDQRQEALSKSSRYNLAFAAVQTSFEVTRLGQVLGAHRISSQLMPARDVQVRFEIFLSRVALLDSPEFAAFAAEDPSHAAMFADIRSAADALIPLMDQLSDQKAVEQAAKIILDLTPKVAAFGSAAYHTSALRSAEDARDLQQLHWIYSGFTAALIVSGLLLLLSLARQKARTREAKEAAERAQAQAESASQAKTEFLAAVSHEIRTPLNSVMGFTDLILDRTDLAPEMRRQVELIKTASSTLLTIVNDVLDFATIEAGAVELDPKPFPPAAIVGDCLSIVHGLASTKGLDLSCRTDPSVPALLVGDGPRLRQILLNLLNNAIKFTPSGSVTLTVTPEHAGDGRDRYRFAVTDTGIGIPKEKQDRLFQRFTQVDGSARRQYGGTGLGLAISKRLVELMGGEIGVVSEVGQGSTFWFSVPLTKAAERVITPVQPVQEPSVQSRGARILLAEDVDINQEIAKAVLEAAGHEVDVVSDGAQAIMAVQQKSYDLVLMDVQMPVMDGVTATQHIRSLSGPVRDIPIVAMTANVYAEQIAGFLEAGMNDHVGKPFDREKLYAAVKRWARTEGEVRGGVTEAA